MVSGLHVGDCCSQINKTHSMIQMSLSHHCSLLRPPAASVRVCGQTPESALRQLAPMLWSCPIQEKVKYEWKHVTVAFWRPVLLNCP